MKIISLTVMTIKMIENMIAIMKIKMASPTKSSNNRYYFNNSDKIKAAAAKMMKMEITIRITT